MFMYVLDAFLFGAVGNEEGGRREEGVFCMRW